MGSTEGSFIPDPRESDGNFRDRSGNVVFSALNEEALQVIAEETDGYYSKGMGAGFIGKLDSALAEMDRFREEGKHQRVAKPAHRWFVFGGLLLIMASVFIKCLPFAPTIALVVCLVSPPHGLKQAWWKTESLPSKAGEATTAQQLFGEAAKDSSGDRAARLYLASGSAASRAQDWPTAVTSFSSALSAEDSEILQQAHYALATSLFYLGASKANEEKVKAWEGSIEHFKASLKIQPKNEASRENLQSVQRQLTNLQKEKEQKEEEKSQEKKDEEKRDSEKNDPQKETQNDTKSEDTSDESKGEKSNQNLDEENEDNPSNKIAMRVRTTNLKIVRVKMINGLKNQSLTMRNQIKTKVIRGRIRKTLETNHRQRIQT